MAGSAFDIFYITTDYADFVSFLLTLIRYFPQQAVFVTLNKSL